MARKNKQVTERFKQEPVVIPVAAPIIQTQPFGIGNYRLWAMLVFILAAGIYFNSGFNGYALDDGIVITENPYTKQGFTGISDIFSHETFSNIADQNAELSGGRYRPLSIAMLAIEYQFFGANPGVNHFINVLMYALMCVLLFYLLKQYVFKTDLTAALIAALLFVVHPLHTDVVANIKGRDEILCLLLLLVCIIYYLRYVSERKFGQLVISLAAYFFSLLAKENGITFIAVIPLLLYFFFNKTIKNALLSVWPFVAVFMIYFFIRLSIVGLPQGETNEVMNAPFIKAVGDEVLATKVMIMGKYLWMMVWPHPLSYDYSYNQIPYVHFTNWKTIVSLLVNALLVFIAIKLFSRRHVISFAILFYFITISIVSNFVFEVGSPFNERFLFQPSIGFCIALAFCITYLVKQMGGGKPAMSMAAVVSIGLTAAGSVLTISRNRDWKNNETLFMTDVKHAPNSAKTNNFAGITLIRKSELEKDSLKKDAIFNQAIPYLKRSLEIYPGFSDPYINLGNIYSQQGKLDIARENLLKAKSIYPGNSVMLNNLKYVAQLYEAKAIKTFAEKNTEEAIRLANLSLDCDPLSVNMLYNLGGYYLTLQRVDKARDVWQKALAIEPGNKMIKGWLDRISGPPTPIK